MNDEQNSIETSAATGNETVAAGNTPPSQLAPDNDNAKPQDDYYDVDHAKKEVLSTIGDGEMHDEGLVGAGDVTTDFQSSITPSPDEQDEAESYDTAQ